MRDELKRINISIHLIFVFMGFFISSILLFSIGSGLTSQIGTLFKQALIFDFSSGDTKVIAIFELSIFCYYLLWVINCLIFIVNRNYLADENTLLVTIMFGMFFLLMVSFFFYIFVCFWFIRKRLDLNQTSIQKVVELDIPDAAIFDYEKSLKEYLDGLEKKSKAKNSDIFKTIEMKINFNKNKGKSEKSKIQVKKIVKLNGDNIKSLED